MAREKIYLLITVLIAMLIMLSCNSASTNSEDKNYSGITETNEGYEIISVDADDWGCSDIIEPDTGSHMSLPEKYCFGPAFPNPSTDVTMLQITVPVKSFIKVWLTDGSNFTVELLNDSLNPGMYFFAWNCSDVSPGIYRAFLETNLWQCHGDILVQ